MAGLSLAFFSVLGMLLSLLLYGAQYLLLFAPPLLTDLIVLRDVPYHLHNVNILPLEESRVAQDVDQ